ncbi:hypothetical protein [Paraburkholderia youngii]|uniref:hypothetical protein n=1 Tax=Paraburkholderia youngii TaxID=2782701 RepID=UPI003D1DFC5C
MKRAADDDHGLWLNILHLITLTGWTQAQIAELMFPYTTREVSLQDLKHALGYVISRKQHRWKYAAALAEAFGLSVHTLTDEDLRKYQTLAGFQRAFGFNRADVLRRSEAKASTDIRWQASITANVAEYFRDLKHEAKQRRVEYWSGSIPLRRRIVTMHGDIPNPQERDDDDHDENEGDDDSPPRRG